MSLAQDYLDRLLKLDVESYLRGKAPGALALRAAPLLEDWRIERVCEPTDGPPSVRLENATVITGHTTHAGGGPVTTARLIRLDRHGQWARTGNGLCRLGQRASAAAGPR